LTAIPAPWLPYGEAQEIAPGARCVLAQNPSPLTGSGTNTYLIGQSALALIDPGPDDPKHLQAILNALRPNERISHIFVTHAHKDHSTGTKALSDATGAPVFAMGGPTAGRSATMTRLAQEGLLEGGEGIDHSFEPDERLADNELITGDGWALQALWTPGHFGNHMAFALGDQIFCGDLVMGWATTLVSPPDGDLAAFLNSCERLLQIAPKRLFPGRGAPIEDPSARISELISHRKTRERQILAALAKGPATKEALTAQIYQDVPQHLWPAAARNVLAHLIHLSETGTAHPLGPLTADAQFELIK